MKKFDETKPIRDKFEAFEASAPDFDSLFEGEVLGNAAFHQIYQSKLANMEAEAPIFEELFAGQTLINIAPKRRMIPIWLAVGAAAACLGLLLLLPEKTLVEPNTFSQVEKTTIIKSHRKIKKPKLEIQRDDILAQKIESPKTIEALSLDDNEPSYREKLVSYAEVQKERNVTYNESRKINPSSNADLAVDNERSIEEAYAEAKVKKASIKREKMTFGANLNSTNRLLSQVNTKAGGNYPLQGIASNYTAGFSSLEGSSSSLLRSATSYRNDWVLPENLENNIQKNYEAVYSLPFSFGLSVSLPFMRHFELMTGLNYTYLSGTISGETSNLSFNLKQELHYIGLPVKISINFLKLNNFGAYVALGGTLEKALAGIQHSHVKKSDGSISDWENSQSVYGLQSSITGQFGVYYELNKTLNIYFEPGVSYFIPSDQPISSRTEEPFNFNLGVGLRYRIN